jgi:deazaflavin-dependent oxidoreductase (nitroreductase family)
MARRRTRYERIVIRLAAFPWFVAFGRWVLSPVDRVLHRFGLPVLSRFGTGFPTVFVTTTGVRSGLPRTVPLFGIRLEDGFGLIASNFGQDRRPAWCLNLLADPACIIEHDGGERRYRARLADPEVRRVIWDRAVEIYPVWNLYARRVRRTIDVFHALPADDPA